MMIIAAIIALITESLRDNVLT